MDNIFDDIQKRFEITDIVKQDKNLNFLTCKKELTVSLITHLKNIEGFSHFVLLTAVDWIEDEKFQLTYILNNPDKRIDIGIRTYIDRGTATMDTAHHLWEHVATYQRELKEMFGIDFPGSPRVDEQFILEGWDDIPPYRRDFDTLKYAEETFFPREGRKSNDPAEYMKKKLYPDEEK
ncbi:MAG: NADH-quinone oxidoreductase subunit C [Bacteroidales bacterium]|nr:NADH-quinone oxidoreductase subunit C [Bacteroidales bacterium]